MADLASLKNIIFSLFNYPERRDDINKDLLTAPEFVGKGTQQRFQELCAEEFDDELLGLLNGIYDNTLNIDTLNEEFLEYLESKLGLEFMGVADVSIRRKAIRYSVALVSKKGTIKGFEMFYNLIGIPLSAVTITERFNRYTFDDPEADFDHPIRRLDSKCSCPLYTIDIDTSVLDVAEIELLTKLTKGIIEFMEPISAKLDNAVYWHLSLTTNKNGTVNLDFTGTGNVVIDWGDNVVETFDMGTGTATHIYTSSDERTILLTFANPDNFSALDWQNNCLLDLYIADAILNNDTDFTLDLRTNLITDAVVQAFMISLLDRSDATKSNDILVNLLSNQLTKPIDTPIKAAKYDLRDNHAIEVLLGGGYNIGYNGGFNTV